MTLVPEGLELALTTHGDHACASVSISPKEWEWVTAATPALAICIAALRAKDEL
jgi:hypothetical protein